MLFNSLEFLIFLPIVFYVYWFLLNKNLKLQNIFILIASLVFYGWWDWRFLLLMIFSSMIDYFCSIRIQDTESKEKKKLFLGIALTSNLIILGFFKYYNFFTASWIDLMNQFGITTHASTLNIVLPVGISFYTFQAMSYTVDVYRRQLEPTKDYISYLTFVSFFPQLVAGPIERATNLLPQILKPRTFTYEQGIAGIRLIIFGLFKKVVIADTLAPLVDEVFRNYETVSSATLVWGAVMFAFQIYGDFGGYSDIAIGTSKLFGVELMSNFRFPYLSRDIGEFWRRWHISLSTWFRDYVYIPLGGSKTTRWKSIRNIFIIFLASGFWHGANWTFLIWGLIHALLFIPLFIFNVNRKNASTVVAHDRMLPSVKELMQILITFSMVCIAWIFFRSPDLSSSLEYIQRIFQFQGGWLPSGRAGFTYVVVLIILDWIMRRNEREIKLQNKVLDYMLFLVLALAIFYFWDISDKQQDFIYFQF